MDEFESLPRETGALKSGKFCSDCGAELPAVVSSFGSIRPGACTSCSSAPAGDPLKSQLAKLDEDELDEEVED